MRKPLILSLMLCVAACGGGEEKRDRPAPLVNMGAATQHVFSDRYVAVGTANANEQVSVRAPVTERITQLGFSDGDYVRQGQMLAVLAQGQETASLASAQARARQAWPSARAAAPSWSAVAPVKEPFSCPKSSLSIKLSGIAAQLTAMKGLPAR